MKAYEIPTSRDEIIVSVNVVDCKYMDWHDSVVWKPATQSML